MARDDTVCKFCGVSYLIHNEMKRLEDRLKAAEEELIHLRGCQHREEELKKLLEELKLSQQTLKDTITAKDAM